jgi:glycosyltransferase involved in cell wall biosynthesis
MDEPLQVVAGRESEVMRVSGFTFCRDGVKFDFPVVEAITSILPIVDEFIVNVGKSEDGTLDLVRSIKDPRIKIVESVWDETLTKDGKVFGIQQDIALSHCTGDWAFLVQADEVVHEEDLSALKRAMEESFDDSQVLGLVLRMLHFKGDYWSLDPWMYRKATRIIRNHRGISSSTDGCDFRTKEKDQMIKSGPNGRLINARLFHYGYVKEPKTLQAKLAYQKSRHDGDSVSQDEIAARSALLAQFPTYDILKTFCGTHPRVMHDRIAKASRLRPHRNRWLNWRFYLEIARHGFKG